MDKTSPDDFHRVMMLIFVIKYPVPHFITMHQNQDIQVKTDQNLETIRFHYRTDIFYEATFHY